MADFEAIIRRTIDGLVEDTPEMRGRIYEKAREAAARQLRNMSPRPSESMIDRQMAKLEAAILAIETGAFSQAQTLQDPVRDTRDMRSASSSILLKWFLPPSIASDFFDGLSEVHEMYWLPLLGEKSAKWRWHRECASMIARNWFDSWIANARRFGRLK